MRSFSQWFCDKPDLLLIITAVLFLIGVVVGIIAAASKKQKIASREGRLPLDVAKHFKTNFDAPVVVDWFHPDTECVIHDYKKLKTYIDSLEREFQNIKPKPSSDSTEIPVACRHGKQYKKGVAFYFGKTYKDHYAQEFDKDKFEAVLKDSYTMFILPVAYTTEKKEYVCKNVRMRDGTVVKEKKVSIETIEKIKDGGKDCLISPIDKVVQSSTGEASADPFSMFRMKAAEKFNRNEDEAFDLGHTHP